MVGNKKNLVIITGLIVLGCIVGIIIFHLHKGDSSNTPRYEGAALYLLPEVGGFDAEDIKLTGGDCFIDPSVASKMFTGGIVVIANNADPNGLDAQWNNTRVLNLVDKSGLPLRKWISFYFGKDGIWCKCANGADKDGEIKCTSAGKPCQKCTSTESVKWNINTCSLCKNLDNNYKCLTGHNSVVDQILAICNNVPDLEGIMFDDEVGDPTNIIQVLETVKKEWDKKNRKGLLLGWTRGLKDANLLRPRGLPGNYTWDICLGQAYTNTTGNYYSESCTPAPGWWENVKSALGNSSDSKGVPMVCGAGNCIGDKGNKSLTKNPLCLDERLSGDVITQLLQNRPVDFPWKNFAIWYGTYSTGKGFFNCVNTNCPINKGCCRSGWVCGGGGCTK